MCWYTTPSLGSVSLVSHPVGTCPGGTMGHSNPEFAWDAIPGYRHCAWLIHLYNIEMRFKLKIPLFLEIKLYKSTLSLSSQHSFLIAGIYIAPTDTCTLMASLRVLRCNVYSIWQYDSGECHYISVPMTNEVHHCIVRIECNRSVMGIRKVLRESLLWICNYGHCKQLKMFYHSVTLHS